MKLNPVWDFAFGLTLAAVTFWYYRSNQAQASVSKVRQGLFYLGMGLLAMMLVGPIPHKAVTIFWVHMIQHISIMMLIAPLIVLGSPFKVALEAKSSLGSIARKLSQSRLIRTLFKAEVGFVIFLAVLILTHFSPLANAGMRNPNIHCLELIIFLLGGLIYYYPVMEANPQPFPVSYSKRVISLFAMMLPETMTGFFLYSGNRVLHALPDSRSMSMGLTDQHTGGAIMWSMGMLIDSMWIVLAARDWFENERLLAEAEDEH
jgi:cytochrome c oxidase assembly factor CtaG